MQLTENLQKQLVDKIVQSTHPEQIILFGSYAQKREGKGSDLDLLIVVADGTHRRNTAQRLYEELINFPFSKDIVVATESDIRIDGNSPYKVYKEALNTGKLLYSKRQ
jgi:predicted nucleotidyltransferase